MATFSHEERFDRLERVVHVIAEDQLSLQKLIADLATETRRGFQESDRRARATDERLNKFIAESDRRAKATDERIDKLVVAIGEWIRRRN